MKTLDLTPTWETAVNIYISVLQNPNASHEAVKSAKEDLISLARSVDALNQNKKELQ